MKRSFELTAQECHPRNRIMTLSVSHAVSARMAAVVPEPENRNRNGDRLLPARRDEMGLCGSGWRRGVSWCVVRYVRNPWHSRWLHAVGLVTAVRKGVQVEGRLMGLLVQDLSCGHAIV